MRLFIKHPLLLHPNQMELLNGKIGILDVIRMLKIHMYIPTYLWQLLFYVFVT